MVDMFRVSGFMYMSDPPHGMLILDLQAGGSPTPTPTPAPAFSVQPTITGTPQVGVSTVGNPGTASNTTGHTYRWLLSTTSGGVYAAISGAIGTTYTPISTDETKYLKFEDTATGPGGITVATTAFAGPVAAAAAVDAPVLSNLSSGWTTGQNPPAWQSTYPNVQGYNSFSGAGDQVRAHWKLGAGAWTATAWEPLDDELATGDAPAWPFLTDNSLNAGGVFQVWEEIVRDLGLGTEQTSAASNTWTDTISAVAATPATWDPAAKSTNFTLSNSNKTATVPVDPGGDCMVIGTLGKTTGKWYFEVAATMGTVFHAVGVGLANSLPADYTIPGSATNTAITYHGNSLVYRNSGNDGGVNQVEWDNTTGTKIIGVAFDADADKVWFAIANTYAGSPTAGTGGHAPTGITTYYPLYMARTPGEPGTLRTLTADMTYSPPTGFTALGGA
jgi:hypothetical protein